MVSVANKGPELTRACRRSPLTRRGQALRVLPDAGAHPYEWSGSDRSIRYGGTAESVTRFDVGPKSKNRHTDSTQVDHAAT